MLGPFENRETLDTRQRWDFKDAAKYIEAARQVRPTVETMRARYRASKTQAACFPVVPSTCIVQAS